MCTLGCQPIIPVIGDNITAPKLSKCMKVDKKVKAVKNEESMEIKWIQSAIRSALANEKTILNDAMICRFNIFSGYISRNKVHVLNFPHLNKAINLPKPSRVLLKQRGELFKFYEVREI